MKSAVYTVIRPAIGVVLLLGACGPAVDRDDDAADEKFLADAEASVDAYCTHFAECKQYLEEVLLIEIFGPFPGNRCHEPLLDTTERIHSGERCQDPYTMLNLYDCLSTLDCGEMEYEGCKPEYQAVEAALCNPF